MNASINDLEIYRESMSLAEVIWDSVGSWPLFAKDTLGKQIVRSADSIAANLAEGYGRYHFKENQKFCYYSRGSLQETQTWIEKAVRRNLIPDEAGRALYREFDLLKKRLNAYIRSIGPVESDTSDR
ncbi:four helix bundle protein [Luteolibacter sp. GHJ8]|uniref:Four helix bundle protein n=1 Tax=Luteolibacter rhizosphaerae TaxID=2989719 RepID=A0ABT3FZ94_9BACT|nr:four helix bundle protein [Luteolibacter rhizosphaerae]MCW1912896.1 four helix bundle protein [Luteolibacter rhizosphaerae]